MNQPVSPAFLVGLIGAGIQHSRSPALHEHEGAALGVPYQYKLIDLEALAVGVEALPDLVLAAERMGFVGLNITHPCKQAVIPLLHELSPDARRDRVVQLGAGGAGAAVAHAALTLGTARLAIFDVQPARAEGVARDLCGRFGEGRAVAGQDLGVALAEADGLINATPIGMANHPGLPLPASLLRPALWVAEVVYFPLETELLRTTRALGCRTLDGGGMAVFQAAEGFRLFTGLEPDAERMLRDFASMGG